MKARADRPGTRPPPGVSKTASGSGRSGGGPLSPVPVDPTAFGSNAPKTYDVGIA
jgi:hypothetical protein